MNTKTLYQRRRGADFERLPPVLQHANGLAMESRVTGSLTIKNGTGLVRQGAARSIESCLDEVAFGTSWWDDILTSCTGRVVVMLAV
jgi:hypothetical protein